MSSSWHEYQPNKDKVFFYWKNEMTPRYTFERKGLGTNFVGHGIYAMSIKKIREWVESQPDPK